LWTDRHGWTEKAKTFTHDHIMQASVRVDAELRRRSQLLWDDRSLATRGPKAAFTPDDVVKAAVQIADEDGLSAVTMSAVSARLGLTTMAVYRYFPSKEALIDAIVDAGLGQPPRPSRMHVPGGTTSRSGCAPNAPCCARGRGWPSCRLWQAPHGPNWLRWLEALLAPLMRTGVRPADAGELLQRD
jgi:AcrR family transcriptional regulator